MQVKDVEWFAFGGQVYRRERASIDQQRLFSVFADHGTGTSDRAFLARDEINAAAKHLAAACNAPLALEADDDYPLRLQCQTHRSSGWCAAATGFISTEQAARCWKSSIVRDGLIVGSTTSCTRSTSTP